MLPESPDNPRDTLEARRARGAKKERPCEAEPAPAAAFMMLPLPICNFVSTKIFSKSEVMTSRLWRFMLAV